MKSNVNTLQELPHIEKIHLQRLFPFDEMIDGERAREKLDRIIETTFIKIITVFPLLSHADAYLIRKVLQAGLINRWTF